ncbi:O-antigen ligase family protein [Acidicapsa acidisoli]|uniref:O-antigen ligase family protein n=1 Tax=Acidicapsa acidisoli TaxID=1615681 RepID=UPI0021E0B6FA|nr:oligosaccharide repeat unit polymerase [Acidicapsa acidisoli]
MVEDLNPRNVPARAVKLLPAVIGFFFSFRLFFVLLTTHVLNADPQTGVMLSLGLNYILLAIVVFHSIGNAPRTLASITRLPCYRWVLCFLGFSGVSLIWSATSSVPAAVAFWCAMAADLAMVILLLRTDAAVDISSSIMKGYVYGACCIALIAWIMPAQSDLRLGDDEFLGPNQIGYACAFAVFFAQYLMRAERGRWKLPTAFLAITLLRSLSKTTIFAFVAGEAVIFMWDKSISRKTKIALLLGTVLVFVIFWGLLTSYYDVYTNAGNQAETLTGRLGIWAFILDKSLEQPWIGHGFHSVWKVIPPFGSDQFEARHAHNELLQQFYAYGVVGIFLLIALYGSFFRQIKRLSKSPLRALLLGLLVFVVVRGLADTEAFDLSLPLWAIAMFSAIIAEFRTNNSIMPSASFETLTALSELDNEAFSQKKEAYDNPR